MATVPASVYSCTADAVATTRRATKKRGPEAEAPSSAFCNPPIDMPQVHSLPFFAHGRAFDNVPSQSQDLYRISRSVCVPLTVSVPPTFFTRKLVPREYKNLKTYYIRRSRFEVKIWVSDFVELISRNA